MLGRAFQPEGTAYAKALGDEETNPVWKSAVPQNTGCAVGNESGDRWLPAGLGPECPSERFELRFAGVTRQAEAGPKG